MKTLQKETSVFRELFFPKESTKEVRTVAISPDGTLLAFGSSKGKIKIWSFPEGKVVKELKGHDSEMEGINAVAISPDGELLGGLPGLPPRPPRRPGVRLGLLCALPRPATSSPPAVTTGPPSSGTPPKGSF